MHFARVEKGPEGAILDLYDQSMKVLESESFADLYALNFYLQTLASKHKIQEALMVIYNRESCMVDLSLVQGENSFFIS